MATVACAASVGAAGVVGKRQHGLATRSARAPRAAAGRTRVVPVQCQQQEQEQSSASVAGRGLLLSALAAGLTLASTPMAEASSAYDRCQTDACRELVSKMEAARNANPPPVAPAVAPSPAPAPAPAVSSGPASSVQPARADEAAAERARARAAAEKERADREAERARRAASNNASGGALAWVFGTSIGMAALTATATTVSTGSFSDLTSGNFNGWYRKALDQLKASNTSVVLGTVGAIVATDGVAHLVPILNLLLPKVLELVGVTIVGYYGTKYLVKKEGSPKDDINNISKVLPSSLPPVGKAVDAVTTTGKTTLNFFKSIKPDSLTDDAGKYFKSLDNQAAVVALAAGIFVGILLLDNIAHFPVLGLVFPKYLELVGVTATLLAANKYALDGKSVQSDADGVVKELTKVQVPVLSSLGSSSSLPSSSSSSSSTVLKDKPKVGASTKAAIEAEVMDVE